MTGSPVKSFDPLHLGREEIPFVGMGFINNQRINSQIGEVNNILFRFFVIEFIQHFKQLFFLPFCIFDGTAVVGFCNQSFKFLQLSFIMLLYQIGIIFDHIKGRLSHNNHIPFTDCDPGHKAFAFFFYQIFFVGNQDLSIGIEFWGKLRKLPQGGILHHNQSFTCQMQPFQFHCHRDHNGGFSRSYTMSKQSVAFDTPADSPFLMCPQNKFSAIDNADSSGIYLKFR